MFINPEYNYFLLTFSIISLGIIIKPLFGTMYNNLNNIIKKDNDNNHNNNDNNHNNNNNDNNNNDNNNNDNNNNDNKINKILFIKTITTGENPYYHKIKELFINYNNKFNDSTICNNDTTIVNKNLNIVDNNISFHIKLLSDSTEYLEDKKKDFNDFLNNYLSNDIVLFISGFNNDIYFIKNYLYKYSGINSNKIYNIKFLNLKKFAQKTIEPPKFNNMSTGWWTISNENDSTLYYKFSELIEYLNLNKYKNADLLEKIFEKLCELNKSKLCINNLTNIKLFISDKEVFIHH